MELYAFLDTGGELQYFPVSSYRGSRYRNGKGREDFCHVGSGSLIPVYLHGIDVKFADKEFKAEIGFSKHLGIGFNIIGRKDFFDNFKICFDEKNEMVEIF